MLLEGFFHGLGHGVGLEVHEAPSLGMSGWNDTLVPGDVVTLEPGLYRDGFGRCRLEDLVLVTETAPRTSPTFRTTWSRSASRWSGRSSNGRDPNQLSQRCGRERAFAATWIPSGFGNDPLYLLWLVSLVAAPVAIVAGLIAAAHERFVAAIVGLASRAAILGFYGWFLSGISRK